MKTYSEYRGLREVANFWIENDVNPEVFCDWIRDLAEKGILTEERAAREFNEMVLNEWWPFSKKQPNQGVVNAAGGQQNYDANMGAYNQNVATNNMNRRIAKSGATHPMLTAVQSAMKQAQQLSQTLTQLGYPQDFLASLVQNIQSNQGQVQLPAAPQGAWDLQKAQQAQGQAGKENALRQHGGMESRTLNKRKMDDTENWLNQTYGNQNQMVPAQQQQQFGGNDDIEDAEFTTVPNGQQLPNQMSVPLSMQKQQRALVPYQGRQMART